MSILDMLELGRSRRTPVVRQSEAGECGLACLAMVAAHHGLNADMTGLRRQFGASQRGASLKHMLEIAEQLGLSGRAVRVDIDELRNVRLPAVIHWKMNHFVVLTRSARTLKGNRYWINDPAAGASVIGEVEFSRNFTGIALEISRSEGFRPSRRTTQFGMGQLWSGIRGAGGAMSSLVAFSVVLQLIALASPFYLQLALDSVLPAADVQLLRMLALGFGGLILVETSTRWLRTLALLNLTSAFTFQVIDNLYRHLVTLPLSWFERRHVGDVVSRFGSVEPVTDLLSQGLASAVLDGFLTLVTLVLMVIYSPLLAAVAVAACALYAILRLTSFAAMRGSNVSSITASAQESSAFIETVRGMATIKAFGREATRQRLWQSLKATTVNARLKLGRLSAGFDAVSGTVLAAERVLFVYLAVGMAMRGGFSVGMIFAFQAYKSQFLEATTRLVDQALRYRMVDVHLSRIADIALASPEPRDGNGHDGEVEGHIELRNVSFRYGAGEPFILRSVSLEVQAGEMIAIVGPSGGGKTTLLKLMMGLLEPTAGEVLIDGKPLSRLGRRAWRRQTGSVLQEDRLFAGSLAENVAFFDPELDMDLVRDVCRRSAVLQEIEAMPLGFETLVGDMGSSLSGGQRQRVMLARALYARPKVLFMDEGTANLDPVAEAGVIQALRALDATRLLSVHRPLALGAASRVLLVRNSSVEHLSAPAADRPGGELDDQPFGEHQRQ